MADTSSTSTTDSLATFRFALSAMEIGGFEGALEDAARTLRAQHTQTESHIVFKVAANKLTRVGRISGETILAPQACVVLKPLYNLLKDHSTTSRAIFDARFPLKELSGQSMSFTDFILRHFDTEHLVGLSMGPKG